jgi:hypothetical protein
VKISIVRSSWAILVARLNAANGIDWSWAAMDGGHIDAKRGMLTQAGHRSPGQARQQASQICDGNGTPIYVLTSGANVHDISRTVDLPGDYPPIAGRPQPALSPIRDVAGRQDIPRSLVQAAIADSWAASGNAMGLSR